MLCCTIYYFSCQEQQVQSFYMFESNQKSFQSIFIPYFRVIFVDIVREEGGVRVVFFYSIMGNMGFGLLGVYLPLYVQQGSCIYLHQFDRISPYLLHQCYLKQMKQESYKKKLSPHKVHSDWNNYPSVPLSKLRTSDMKFEQRSSDLYLLRNSFSSAALRNFQAEQSDFRLSNLNSMKKAQMENLKATLDKLEDKVNAAKQQLQISTGQMKKKPRLLVHYQQAHQQNQSQTQQQHGTPTTSPESIKKSDKMLASLITNVPKPKNFKPMYTNPYSPRRNNKYYISQALRAANQKNSLILEHITSSIRIIKQCEVYQIPELSEMQEKKLNLKRSQQYRKKKTLVLDLDETLIHCVDKNENEADLQLSIKIEGDDTRLHYFGINIRPYTMTFLKKMAKKFEIIVFTASQQQYADAILDQLDPDKQIFQHRLYRQHCWVLQNQMHIKDLRVINRALSQIVLVDNAAYSYAFQLQNGIPILPFYQGSDYELAALEVYLDEIERTPDVRELNKQTFKLHHYTKFCNGQQLIQELYMSNVH